MAATIEKVKAKHRVAQIIASSVEVLCQECGEPQPNPDDGSFIWTAESFRHLDAASVRRACSACDAPIEIHVTHKVQFR